MATKELQYELDLRSEGGSSCLIGKIKQKADENRDLFWSFFKSFLFSFLFLWHHVPFLGFLNIF